MIDRRMSRLARWLLAPLLGAAMSSALAQQAASPSAPAAATAQAAPAGGPPPGFVAPAEPKADDSNAQRAKSQPGNNAPLWRDVRQSGEQPGFTTLPGLEKGVLIQPVTQYPGTQATTAGEAWRQIRNGFIIPYGGAAIVLALIALALFYFTKGPMGGHERYTGRKIERFTPFERAAHWTNAITWVVLAVSGLVMAFGKFLLLPIIGSTLFGWLTYALKTAHNFAGPLFAVSLLVVFVTFVKDNFPRAVDITWLLKGGGMFGGEHVPSHRFNGGEKVLFWGGVFALGVTVVVSGLVADKLIPWIEATRGNMQIALIVHGTAAMLMMALFIGHIYMGTLGTKDAFKAMRTGYVDEGWAAEHHQFWADDVRAGRIPAQRSKPSVGELPPLVATERR
jgi:formate dehydrogenase subunit gamma